ncbi:MAG: hypothetical protein JST48_08295 [Bacteroidetes bacterium]|nr:hypothetical protein [Bacteroidota bacterium]
MMKSFLVFLSFALPSVILAQTFPFDIFHDGKVVLESGDTLSGSIKYSPQDLLQVRHDNLLESFTARKALYFEIFDQVYKRYRQFYSLPYSATGGYKSPVFFEILAEGKITLLSREKIEYRQSNSPFFYYGGYTTRPVLVNIYYLLRENGNIEDFRGKRNDWYELFGVRQNEMHDYIKENKLDLDRKYQLKQIIDYYNSLFPK